MSLEKPSADAGSLGHLASAKEKGKLLHRRGGGGGVENRNFKEKCILEFGKYKEIPRWLFALLSGANARILGGRLPGACALGKECVFSFSSVRTSDGVSAQQEGKSFFSGSLLWKTKRGGRAIVGPGCSG